MLVQRHSSYFDMRNYGALTRYDLFTYFIWHIHSHKILQREWTTSHNNENERRKKKEYIPHEKNRKGEIKTKWQQQKKQMKWKSDDPATTIINDHIFYRFLSFSVSECLILVSVFFFIFIFISCRLVSLLVPTKQQIQIKLTGKNFKNRYRASVAVHTAIDVWRFPCHGRETENEKIEKTKMYRARRAFLYNCQRRLKINWHTRGSRSVCAQHVRAHMNFSFTMPLHNHMLGFALPHSPLFPYRFTPPCSLFLYISLSPCPLRRSLSLSLTASCDPFQVSLRMALR